MKRSHGKSLVDDYDVSVDGLTYHFTLRDGVVFSDGTPLTADDVKFTFERILSLPGSEQTDYAISIDGAQDMLDGRADELRGITVTDDRHFTVNLEQPFSGFMAQLATPSTSILSRSKILGPRIPACIRVQSALLGKGTLCKESDRPDNGSFIDGCGISEGRP